MEKLALLLEEQFKKMCSTQKLFLTNVSKEKLWETYLLNFKEEQDPVFRDPESSTHNCNHCSNFLQRYGNIVAIDTDNEIISLFDIECDEEYAESMKKLKDLVSNARITNVFTETFANLSELPYEKGIKKSQDYFNLGVPVNHKRYTQEEAEAYPGTVKKNEVKTFHHMHLKLPKMFVSTSGTSQATIMSDFRSAYEVFERTMSEITADTLRLVIDLINQGSLRDSEQHLDKVKSILAMKEQYDSVPERLRQNWCWKNSYKYIYSRFRNELIGVLCVDLSEGKDLNIVWREWNKRVDPKNYMQATTPITETQKKKDVEIITNLGYEDSLDRRHATISDILVEEIHHINEGKKVIIASKFDSIVTTSKFSQLKKSELENVTEIPVAKFLELVPTFNSMEVYLENKHQNNFVNMTNSIDPDTKKMLAWNNNLDFTFNGNIASTSSIKEEVKRKGGAIDGVLNFRLAWCDEERDDSDLDAWAQEPSSTKIGFNTPYLARDNKRTSSSGQLDVDNTNPGGKLAVENITWNNLSKMREGVYKLWVHQYSASRSKGFKAEIEFEGETFEYSYNTPLTRGKVVPVAEVTLKNGKFSIKHLLPCTTTSKEIYNLKTQEFHKVNLMCLSPNFWGDNRVGNKHYFFMLENCKTDKDIRSFHVEHLNSELKGARKTLERFSMVNMLKPDNEQLAGLGFNASLKGEDVIVRVKGTHRRLLKVKF